jgi:hypothetical protein
VLYTQNFDPAQMNENTKQNSRDDRVSQHKIWQFTLELKFPFLNLHILNVLQPLENNLGIDGLPVFINETSSVALGSSSVDLY